MSRLTPLGLWSLVTMVAALLPATPVLRVVALVGFLVIPGVAFTSAFVSAHRPLLARLAVSAAFGSVVLMLSGFLLSVAGPSLRLERPLDRPTQLALGAVLLLASVVVEQVRGVPGIGEWRSLTVRGVWRNAAGVFLAAVLPTLAWLGAARVNTGAGPELARAGLLASVAILVAGVLVLPTRLWEGRLVSLWLLAAPTAALVWVTSLRGGHLFGWDIQQEFSVAALTARDGVWASGSAGDAYRSMLSITALPAQLEAFSGVSIEFVLRGMYPLLFALVPYLVFCSLRHRVTDRVAATVSVALVIASRAYPAQLPAIGRQMVALMLFAAAMFVISGTSVAVNRRRIGAAVLLSALAFTHYTTAYATAAMVLFAAVVAVVAGFRRPDRRAKMVFTVPVAVSVVACTLVWNLTITRNGTVLDQPARGVATNLEILDTGAGKPFLKRWLEGTGSRRGTVEEYAGALGKDLAEGEQLAWMTPDGEIAPFLERDARPERFEGPLAAYTRLWNVGYLGAAQLALVIMVLGCLGLLRRRWRSDQGADLVALAFGALAMTALLRVSTSAASFYNAERAALLLDQVASRLRAAIPAVALFASVLLVGASGSASLVFSGEPPGGVSVRGENVERFVVSEQELATVRWISGNVPEGALVQADRYGNVRLLNVSDAARYGVVDILHSDFIDHNAWVLLTRANVVEGRARGLREKIFAVYTSPTAPLEENRTIVYATDETRVAR